MYKDKKIVAIIPARLGSVGIKTKHLRKLGDKALVEYTIEDALASKYLDKIILSTDCPELLKIGVCRGLSIKGPRPSDLAQDDSRIEDVLKYEIINHDIQDYDSMMLLQFTSPLRPERLIDGSIETHYANNSVSSVGVHLVSDPPELMRTIGPDLKLEPVIKHRARRRQEFKTYFRVNGMMYINNIQDFLDNDSVLNLNENPIVINPFFCVDIDVTQDLAEAERRLEIMNRSNLC